MKAELRILLQGTFFWRHPFHQAVIDQGFYPLKRIIQPRRLILYQTDSHSRVQCPAAKKHAEATKKALLWWIKQLIAPLQRLV